MLLRTARIDAGLSQKELATKAGVSQTLISGVERGEIQITLQKAHKIAAILQCPIENLLTDNEPSVKATSSG